MDWACAGSVQAGAELPSSQPRIPPHALLLEGASRDLGKGEEVGEGPQTSSLRKGKKISRLCELERDEQGSSGWTSLRGQAPPRCGSLARSIIITPPPDGALESLGWEFKGTTPTFLN